MLLPHIPLILMTIATACLPGLWSDSPVAMYSESPGVSSAWFCCGPSRPGTLPAL